MKIFWHLVVSHYSRILILIICINLLCFSTGCASLGDLVAKVLVEAAFKPRHPPLPPVNMEMENFYRSGSKVSQEKPHIRVLKNFNGIHPHFDRIQFTNDQWYNTFFSDNTCSVQFQEILTDSDGKLLPVKIKGKENTFSLQEFMLWNEEMRTTTTKVIIYEYWIVGYNSQTENTLTMMQIPGIYLLKVKDILNNCLS